MTIPAQAEYAHQRSLARQHTRGSLPLAGLLAAVLAIVAACGIADVPAAYGQVDEVVEESITRRPRLDFESYGLSLDPVDRGARATGGSPVYSFSRLEVEAGHDSNVRRTASAESASLYAVTRPGVSLNLDGENHQSMVVGQAAIGRYRSSGGDDYEDLELTARSRVEVDEDLEVQLAAGASRLHVARGSDLDLGPSFGTQTYQSYDGTAQVLSTALPDYPVLATLQSTWQRFDDVDGIDRSGLDRWLGVGTARVGVARAGEVSFFVQPGIQRVDYTDTSAVNPDSTRVDLAVGATYAGGSVSQITGFVGASRRSYDRADTSAELSALVGLNALWNATDLMTVNGNFSLSNEDSELSAASSVTTTKLALGLDYEILENVIFGSDIRVTDNRYEGTAEDERLLGVGLDLRYLLNEYAYVGAGLRWEDQSSGDAASEYRATVASLRLGLKLCCLRDIAPGGPDGREMRQGVVDGVFR